MIISLLSGVAGKLRGENGSEGSLQAFQCEPDVAIRGSRVSRHISAACVNVWAETEAGLDIAVAEAWVQTMLEG